MADDKTQERGIILVGQEPVPPPTPEDTPDRGRETMPLPPTAAAPMGTRKLDTDTFATDGLPMRIQFHVRESGAVLECSPNAPIVIGRRNSSAPVDIDLGMYNAQEMGVSRNHARIEPMSNRLFVRDLDTVNGSFLNGSKMSGMQAYDLRDGDELKLGRIHIRVKFIYSHSKRR